MRAAVATRCWAASDRACCSLAGLGSRRRRSPGASSGGWIPTPRRPSASPARKRGSSRRASNLGDARGPRQRRRTRSRSPTSCPRMLRVPATVASAGMIEAQARSPRTHRSSELCCDCTIEEPAAKQITCRTTSTTQPLAPYTELKIVDPRRTANRAPPAGTEHRQPQRRRTRRWRGRTARPASRSAGRSPSADEPTPFGVERYELTPEEEDGATDTLAGSHPFQLTTTLDLNETLAPRGEGQAQAQPGRARARAEPQLRTAAGPARGPAGGPAVLGRGLLEHRSKQRQRLSRGHRDRGRADHAHLPSPPLPELTEAVPVFNLVPAPGEPARFGLEDTKVPIILDTCVRTGGDYGVNVSDPATPPRPRSCCPVA